MDTARLSPDGLSAIGTHGSVPFPIPENGNEAMLNHLMRYRGADMTRTFVAAIVNSIGAYTLERHTERGLFPYNAPDTMGAKGESFISDEVIDPPLIAGKIVLVKEFTDPSTTPRRTWVYTPKERQVRRTPDQNDNLGLFDTEGLETVDDRDLFSGALDRYDWKLVGRKEIYVPYNCYRLSSSKYTYSSLVGKAFVNPEATRWELHRVWVVDGTLKANARHPYARRTEYIDEDSWQMLISDRYDSAGRLWRTGFAYPVVYYQVPLLIADSYEYTDLLLHRYVVTGLHNQEKASTAFNRGAQNARDFTAEALRTEGLR